MDDTFKIAFVLAYGYLLGSVPAAYIVGRMVKGVDIREVGSGTVGSSNVFFNVSKVWVVPLGVFDLFVKGLSPIYVARGLGLDIEVQAVAGLLAVVGHNWPLFLGFKGGRGVAPTIGVLIGIARMELALVIVLAAAGWGYTKDSPAWVLVSFVSLPVAALLWGRPTAVVLALAGLLLIAVVKRLASNRLRAEGVSTGRLLFNRLVFDRDIRDRDAWMGRDASSQG
ncbi:MAG: glycerol-3-phosphate acyltransferase [Dehalococcoidia bacterium]